MRRTGGLLIHRSYLCGEAKCRIEIVGSQVLYSMTNYLDPSVKKHLYQF